MDMRGIRFPLALLSTVSLWLLFPAAVTVLSDPIIVDYNYCLTASFADVFGGPTGPYHQEYCCPPAPTQETTVVEGLPPPTTSVPRVRLAAQCTDAAYAEKLNRAYALMRALPDDDPRSFMQQAKAHCAYCGSAFFIHNSTGGNSPGIDVHFSWFLYPWHRLYLYFHERILQSLLGDPTFSLSFWNWDSAYTVGGGSTTSPACLAVGHDFPAAYTDSNGGAYDSNRSVGALGLDPKFPDLAFAPTVPRMDQTLYNASEDVIIRNNLGVMKTAMITGGTTTEIFLGSAYRAGETRGNFLPTGHGGSLEDSAHASVHFWTGQDYPIFNDMGPLWRSSRDPVFFSHHSNIDRLWEVWKNLSESHQDYTDPDWLNSQFQFYDENKVLRKVNVSDSLDTTRLGYVYQGANDAAWINFEPSRCSNLTYWDTIAQAKLLPVPQPDSNGTYHFTADQPFIFPLTQPASNGSDLIVNVLGIQVAGMGPAGFDVYLNWLNPQESPLSASCSEYVGRFFNLASPGGQMGQAPGAVMGIAYQQSIRVPLERTGVPQPGPSDVVVVLVPISTASVYTVTFSSIVIDPYYH